MATEKTVAIKVTYESKLRFIQYCDENGYKQKDGITRLLDGRAKREQLLADKDVIIDDLKKQLSEARTERNASLMKGRYSHHQPTRLDELLDND